MVKAKWGQKRICQACGAAFYDLRRKPIICPKCGTEFEAEPPARGRRAKPPAQAQKEPPDPKAKPEGIEKKAGLGADTLPEDEETLADLDEETPGEDELIVDASELGEDEDDVAEVINHVDDEKP